VLGWGITSHGSSISELLNIQSLNQVQAHHQILNIGKDGQKNVDTKLKLS
jgi:hypothetical protein